MDTDTSTCDVVIPYKTSYPDTELFYSLRSFRNVRHRNIYLVGDKPSWYKGHHIEVEHYKWLNAYTVHNQENKIRAACELPELSENFILSNDDFFIMKPVILKQYHRGFLKDHIAQRNKRDQYQRSLVQTLELLNRMGIENPLSFELHVPMIMNKDKRLQLSYDMETWLKRGYIPLFRSLYGNLHIDNAEYMSDVKNVGDFENYTYLSTSEATFKGSIGNYIKQVIQ